MQLRFSDKSKWKLTDLFIAFKEMLQRRDISLSLRIFFNSLARRTLRFHTKKISFTLAELDFTSLICVYRVECFREAGASLAKFLQFNNPVCAEHKTIFFHRIFVRAFRINGTENVYEADNRRLKIRSHFLYFNSKFEQKNSLFWANSRTKTKS